MAVERRSDTDGGRLGTRVVVAELAADVADAIDRLVIEPQTPPAPGPSDVRIAVRSAAVGWVDLLMTTGQYQHVPAPPYTPGMEYAGVIDAVGADVRDWQVGDRVVADGFRTGPRSGGDHQRHGGFASWTLAPADAVFALPAALSFDAGACLLGSDETAWPCLVHRAALRAGETALILGATGATGLAAVHVAHRVGATVIAVGRSADKLAAVQAEGADHVWSGAPEAMAEAVKALTGGRGADVVYDGVGGAMSDPAMRAAAFGARYCVVGWASTPQAGRRGVPPNALPSNLILMKGLTVLGCPTVIATGRDPSIRAERLAALWRWVDQGLRPRIARVWALPEVADAMRAKRDGAYVGGLVLHP
ncbi:MAG: NADPH:quinone oxidoreductase family protein [Myxococcota bacterium]